TRRDRGTDLCNIKGYLGDQDHISSAGNARLQRNPAGIAPHYLQDHHPVVALGGGVQFVQGIGGGFQGGIVAEGEVCLTQVIVDGLGNTHHRNAFPGQFQGDLERAVSPYRDQRLYSQGADVFHDPVGNVHPDDFPVLFHRIIKGVAPIGGAQDSTATGQDPSHTFQGQSPALVQIQQAVKAVLDADHLPAMPDDGGFYHAADDGVQAGAVAAAGEDADFLVHAALQDYVTGSSGSVAGSSGSATGRFL